MGGGIAIIRGYGTPVIIGIARTAPFPDPLNLFTVLALNLYAILYATFKSWEWIWTWLYV